jgi:hypothetical protein
MADGKETPRPEWLRTVVRKYQTGEGHAFLLSGTGIHDVDASSYTLQANIYHIFGNKTVPNKHPQLDFDIVVVYHRAHGFRFLGGVEKRAADAEKFKALLEKTQAGNAAAGVGAIRGGRFSGASDAAGGISGGQKSDILERSKNPALAIPLLNEALQQTDVRLCVILEEFQSICPRGEWDTMGEMFTQSVLFARSWGLDFENVGGHGKKWKSAGTGHILFGITEEKPEVNNALSRGRVSSGWIPVNVGFPVYNEREWYISERVLTPSYLERVSIDFGDNVPDTRQISWLAGATGGLTIRAIEDMRLTGERHGNLSRDMVQRIINETISETFAGQGGSEYLTVINPTKGLRDYGFPPYLVEYLEWFLGEFREGRRRNANILKAGPPGTGKSVLAYAIAYELGYKCVHWSPALTQSKWVGESEQQLQKVLNWVEANLPCMLFVDEIDVALTSRDGGSVDTSGVGSKMLSILMPWLERDDIKGRLLFVGATNRPDNIDSAMKRRLQTIIPVLPPMMPEDRFQVVMNILQREQGLRPEECEVPDEVIGDATRWYTQANLSILVEKAVSLARRQKREFTSDVAGFLRRATELYRVDTARTETLSYLAAAQCTDDDMLPPGFARKQDREVKKLLREIEDDEMGPSERGVR